jgi:hypothetical protein
MRAATPLLLTLAACALRQPSVGGVMTYAHASLQAPDQIVFASGHRAWAALDNGQLRAGWVNEGFDVLDAAVLCDEVVVLAYASEAQAFQVLRWAADDAVTLESEHVDKQRGDLLFAVGRDRVWLVDPADRTVQDYGCNGPIGSWSYVSAWESRGARRATRILDGHQVTQRHGQLTGGVAVWGSNVSWRSPPAVSSLEPPYEDDKGHESIELLPGHIWSTSGPILQVREDGGWVSTTRSSGLGKVGHYSQHVGTSRFPEWGFVSGPALLVRVPGHVERRVPGLGARCTDRMWHASADEWAEFLWIWADESDIQFAVVVEEGITVVDGRRSLALVVPATPGPVVERVYNASRLTSSEMEAAAYAQVCTNIIDEPLPDAPEPEAPSEPARQR